MPIPKDSTKKASQCAGPEIENLTLNEVATELRCCRKTVERFVLLGELRVTRLGRKILVRRDQLRKFLERKTG